MRRTTLPRIWPVLLILVLTSLACSPALQQLDLSSIPGFTPEPDRLEVELATALANQPPAPTLPAVLPTGPFPTLEPFRLPTLSPPSATPDLVVEAGPWAVLDLHAFPANRHYQGDQITLEIAVQSVPVDLKSNPPALRLNGETIDSQAYVLWNPWNQPFIIFSQAIDASSLIGVQQVEVLLPSPQAPDSPQIVAFLIEVLPADQRPAQEVNASWQSRSLDCCTLYYLSGTAAARDIDEISSIVEERVRQVETRLGYPVQRPVPITLIDTMWGHGGLASPGGGIQLTYTDRRYNGLDLPTVVTHEATHWATFPIWQGAPTLLVEGIATYVAGGHFKPEPIPERAAALLQLDRYVPLAQLADDFRGSAQHEVAYLEAAGFVAFLVERNGLPRFIDFYALQGIEASSGSEWLDEALLAVYGQGLTATEEEFRAWLLSQELGEQVEDLRITLDLYTAYREYQRLYAPFQMSLIDVDRSEAPGYINDYLREPVGLENVAIEAMFYDAQSGLREGAYEVSGSLLTGLQNLLATGNFTQEPLVSYLGITQALRANGLELLRVPRLDANTAEALALAADGAIQRASLSRLPNGSWQFDGVVNP